MARLFDYMRDPYRAYSVLNAYGPIHLPDKVHLDLVWRHVFGERLNLRDPRTYNEKLQWLKLHDRNPLYCKLVDKEAVKSWVAERVGSKYVTPTYAVWDRVEEITLERLPDSFVLKTTHGCGGVVICKDKSSFDLEQAKKSLRKSLKHNYFYTGREWPYKHVRPRVIAEAFHEGLSGSDLPDYKFFCFDGVPRYMFVATERFASTETKFDFYDMGFYHLPFTNGHPNSELDIKKPARFEEMKELASVLSAGFPHVRVDFYEAKDGLFFGEMTFYHWSGFVPFDPVDWDYEFGKYIRLDTV